MYRRDREGRRRRKNHYAYTTFFFLISYREPSCAHKIKISLHSGVFGKAAEWLCVKKKKKEGSKWNTQEEDAYNNNNAMFFGGEGGIERDRKVHLGRIRGKFETISTNRETDRRDWRDQFIFPISLSLFLSLVAVEYQFVCAAEWTTLPTDSCVCCPCLVFYFVVVFPPFVACWLCWRPHRRFFNSDICTGNWITTNWHVSTKQLSAPRRNWRFCKSKLVAEGFKYNQIIK